MLSVGFAVANHMICLSERLTRLAAKMLAAFFSRSGGTASPRDATASTL